MANKQFWKKNEVEGNVLLRNKPDRGGVIGYVIVLFPLLGLLLLFFTFFQENWTWGYDINALTAENRDRPDTGTTGGEF